MTTKAKARPTTAAKKKASSPRPAAKKTTKKPAETKSAVSAKKPVAPKTVAPSPSPPPAPRVRLPDEMPVVTDAESLEFLKAIDAFKRRTGKPFPTWTQVLGVAKALGYVRK